MLRRFLLIFPAAASLSLQACWVPQIVSGVRPDIFPSTAPTTAPVSDITLESKLIKLSTRLITATKRTANTFALTTDLAAHRQNLENNNYYNVKLASASFSGWSYGNGTYTSYDSATGARYGLKMLNTADQSAAFDILGQGSYGPPPLPAQSFPPDVYRYRLGMSQPDPLASDALSLNLTGSWPTTIPLRGSYTTTLTGSGQLDGNSEFKSVSLRIDGKTSSDGSQLDGQLGFSTEIDGRVYNGFGTFDGVGFKDTVQIEQNGVPVAQIVRRDKRWDVEINGRISASGD